MKKTKYFDDVTFDPRAIAEARDSFLAEVDEKDRQRLSKILGAEVNGEHWEYDDEDELFADIRRNADEYSYRILGAGYDLIVRYSQRRCCVVAALPNRNQIERIFGTLESNVARCTLPADKSVNRDFQLTVFIGHGRSGAWRDLKDHLQDQHDINIEAYEIGARAGHTIRDILEDMLTKSSIAFLVMTGEDTQEDSSVRARQNVVHEVGLFQGRLGFSRAIVLLEEGAEEFSNLHGIQQIRFQRGSIRETFGDVLATIRREFGDQVD